MELAVDRSVQRQRQTAQIVDELGRNVVNRCFLEVSESTQIDFKHELDDNAVRCGAQRGRMAESTS